MKMSARYSPCEAHGIVTEDKDVSSHFCVVSIVKLTNPLALPGFLACFRSPPNRDTSSRGLSDLREFTLFESDVEQDRNWSQRKVTECTVQRSTRRGGVSDGWGRNRTSCNGDSKICSERFGDLPRRLSSLPGTVHKQCCWSYTPILPPPNRLCAYLC